MNNKKKVIVQICFTLKTGLTMEEISKKLKELKDKLDNEYGEGNYLCKSCHLTKKLCLEKNFSTDIPDIFEEIFGDNYVSMLKYEENYDEAISNLPLQRIRLSSETDKLIILSDERVSNVALELELFTKKKVVIL